MKPTFMCPYCKREIELLNEYAQKAGNRDETRLNNKRFHFVQHKKVKRVLKLVEKRWGQLEEAIKDLKDEESWLG